MKYDAGALKPFQCCKAKPASDAGRLSWKEFMQIEFQ